MLSSMLIPAVVVFAAATLLWMVSVKMEDAGIVDSFWGMGFVLVAFSLWLVVGTPAQLYPLVVLAMVAIWGIRLSWHIFSRNHGHGEDKRYRNWREEVGPSFWWKSLFFVFWFQAALIMLISMPVIANFLTDEPRSPVPLAIGIVVWVIGLLFEAVGDWQLKQFKANPANKGKVMDQGLWRYTRHPNYFGDALVWWGLWCTTLDLSYSWAFVLSPALMTIFLRYWSGVPMLERYMIREKPGYAKYVERTSAFIPWFPKSDRTSDQTKSSAQPQQSLGLLAAVLLGPAAALGLSAQPAAAAGVDADEFSFSPMTSVENLQAPLVGSSVYRHFGLFKVFAAGLYANTEPERVYPTGQHPKYLEIVYYMDIDAEDFADITREGIQSVLGNEKAGELSGVIERFNRLYRDIKEGDRYGLSYLPGEGTTLYLNGEPLGTVADKEFAEGLFGIWLSDRALNAGFRRRLLSDS